MASWAKALPYDVCRMIARLLVRECAVITTQELADQESATCTDSVVELSHNVYVRYVMMDGIRYIAGLRSSPRSAIKAGETLLFSPQTTGNIRNLYIGEDHLGIRQLQSYSSSNASSRLDFGAPGLWWRELPEPCRFQKLRMRTDVGSSKRLLHLQ